VSTKSWSQSVIRCAKVGLIRYWA